MRYLILLSVFCFVYSGYAQPRDDRGGNIDTILKQGVWTTEGPDPDWSGYNLRETFTIKRGAPGRGLGRTGTFEMVGELFDGSGRFVGYKYVRAGGATLEASLPDVDPDVMYLLAEQLYEAESVQELPVEKPSSDHQSSDHQSSDHQSSDHQSLSHQMMPPVLLYHYSIQRNELHLTPVGADEPIIFRRGQGAGGPNR